MIRSKTTEKRWRHRFSHYKSMGAFCCHGNQSFDLICPKTLCSLSPTPVMLHIKFDLGWPAGFRDIQVWKCGRRRTDDGPLLCYKLTLWAFGSGELTNSDIPTPEYNVFSEEMSLWSPRLWKSTFWQEICHPLKLHKIQIAKRKLKTSHRWGFEPITCHVWDKPFYSWMVRWFFSGFVARFYDWFGSKWVYNLDGP